MEAALVDVVFREHHGTVFARLMAMLGDFGAAEDALQDAYVAALQVWPRAGPPDRPVAWITTVARNAALNRLRHRGVSERKRAELVEVLEAEAPPPDELVDERLRLLFTCCHPALAEPARIALTLRTVCGLGTGEIGRLFFVSEATVAQRIVRAKRKIKAAAIPYAIPREDELPDRVDDALACIYLMFTEGYAPLCGTLVVRAPICSEAIRLARLICHALPRHAEARGLLALMLLHHARRFARSGEGDEAVPLAGQDRRRWDAAGVREGVAQLEEALRRREPGPMQLQASIAALHAAAPRHEDTDWSQIAGLYAELLRQAPSPSVAVAFAIADGMADGPDVGLQHLRDAVHAGLVQPDYDRLAAARADLLHRAGRLDEARAAYDEALRCVRNQRDARFLEAAAHALQR